MSFFYNSVSGIWNKAASYFPGTAAYCQDNNINWTSTTNLAKDLGTIAADGTLAAAQTLGNAAMNVVIGAANATPALAYGAKDIVAQAAYGTLESTHAWQFGTQAGTTDAPAKSGATMVTELAGAAGAKVLDFGYSALKSGYATLSSKAMDAGSAVWAELQVQAPALGKALLGDVLHLAGMAAAAAQDGMAVLSGKPLDLGALEIRVDQDDMPHFTDASQTLDAHIGHSDVLLTSAMSAGLDDSAQSWFSDDSEYFGDTQEFLPAGRDQVVSFDDLDADCAPLACSEAWFTVATMGTDLTMSAAC
ncbi:hypothetical protein [Pantoea sp. 18069]|uniref:hypothetical protein n=1 Tax=Pantoea sp. 18069 TaxID=2681415 RepID=UPI00135A50B1|nr:hypothetical protein [Pantoea sp. 18069]